MTQIISGSTGNFKQPIEDLSLYGPTMYGVSDANKEELNLIILTPGCYYDAYKIIRQIGFQDVKIFVPAIDVLFISDIFNLLMETIEYKPTIQWVFPKQFTLPSSATFENSQIIAETYVNQINSSIIIEYRDAGILGREVYDILVKDGASVHYFCQYITPEKLETLYNAEAITTIHLPYTSTLYGGLSYTSATRLNIKYKTKLIADSFRTLDEYVYATENKTNMGKFISNAFKLDGIRGVIPYTETSI